MSGVAERWPQLISDLIGGHDLSREDTAWALDQVWQGLVSPIRLAGFLVALRSKGETVAEINGLVDGMLLHANRFEVPGPTVDLVGTGGDRHHTVNISTMAAITTAATGARVVKHGNRAASSSSGAADVLEKLGVRLDLEIDAVRELANEVGITFCFAMKFHPAMRYAGEARRELGVATVFNFLGPLTNPAQPQASAIGCADLRMAPLIAGVLGARGSSALVFRGSDGLDELAATGSSRVWEVREGVITEDELDWTQALGLDRITLADLRGGSPDHNAQVAREVFSGVQGPIQQTVALNAASALVALGDRDVVGEGTLTQRMATAFGVANQVLQDGSAQALLEEWVAASNRLAPGN